MKKSLKKRILLLMFIFVITLNIISITMNYQNFLDTTQESTLSTAMTVAETCSLIIDGDSLENYIQTGLRDTNYYLTWNKLIDYKNTNSSIVKLSVVWFSAKYEHYIFDTDLSSAGAFLGDKRPVNSRQTDQLNELVDGNNHISLTYPNRIEIYRPVLSSYNLPMGYVVVGMDTTSAERQQFIYFMQLVFVSLLLTVITTIFFMYIINRTIINPINKLSVAVGSYVDSVNANPETSPLANVSIATGDEIEKLFHSIRKMEADIFNSSSNLSVAVWNSQHDSMTQLYNKGYLDETRYSYETNHSLAIIYFDVDNLKKMNDSYGHEAGDEVILKTAHFVHKYQTDERIGFRMGGDEFMLVIPNISDIEIDELVNTMKADPDIHLSKPEQNIKCRIAIGYSYCEGNINLDKLIKIADADMYADKKSHR